MFPHAIRPATLACLERLAAAGTLDGFYLAGGTAAALRLGHRHAEGLDFHSHLEADREAVTVDLDGVRATFRACPHPLLEPATPFRGCAVAGLRDLALLEIAAIARGGRREDFVDLYALLHQGRLSLERLLFDDLPRKFGTALRPVDGLRALAWFDRAVTDPPMTLHGLPIAAVVEEPGPADHPPGEWLRPVEWREVEAFFNACVRALLPRVGRAPRGGRPG